MLTDKTKNCIGIKASARGDLRSNGLNALAEKEAEKLKAQIKAAFNDFKKVYVEIAKESTYYPEFEENGWGVNTIHDFVDEDFGKVWQQLDAAIDGTDTLLGDLHEDVYDGIQQGSLGQNN